MDAANVSASPEGAKKGPARLVRAKAGEKIVLPILPILPNLPGDEVDVTRSVGPFVAVRGRFHLHRRLFRPGKCGFPRLLASSSPVLLASCILVPSGRLRSQSCHFCCEVVAACDVATNRRDFVLRASSWSRARRHGVPPRAPRGGPAVGSRMPDASMRSTRCVFSEGFVWSPASRGTSSHATR